LSYNSQIKPSYPPQAIRQHHTGTVILLITVAPDGSVADVKVDKSSGFHELDTAALAAVKKYRFNPTIRNGVKVSGLARVPITFNLDGAD